MIQKTLFLPDVCHLHMISQDGMLYIFRLHYIDREQDP